MDKGNVDPTGNPEQNPQVDENGNPIGIMSSVITEEVYADMKNVWSVFNLEGSDKVTINELRTIMRAMDVDVSTDEKLEEVRQMIDPDGTGYITFIRLQSVMEEKLKESDTMEDLLSQLKKLDLDNDGKISAP